MLQKKKQVQFANYSSILFILYDKYQQKTPNEAKNMKSAIFPENFISFMAVLILSFCAGLINGILGAGSGIIFLLIPKFFSSSGGREIYSFAMTCVIPVSIISLLSYPSSIFSLENILPLIIPGILGGVVGALLSERIHLPLLNSIFAVITVYSGFSMIFR